MEKHRHLGLSFIKVIPVIIETLALLSLVKQEYLRSHRKKKTYLHSIAGCKDNENLKEKVYIMYIYSALVSSGQNCSKILTTA